MARKSTFKKGGGGFLHEVDATIVGYQLTDAFNGEPFQPGKIKSFDGKGMVDKPHTLNAYLTVRVDGATEDTSTTLKVAKDFDAWEVSEDGLTATPLEDGFIFSGNTQWAKFIESWEEVSGEGAQSDDEEVINYEPIIGTRIRLTQRVDEERTKKFGQKIDKKTKKGYDRKDLVVSAFYGRVEQAKPAGVNRAAKPVGKPNGKVTKAQPADTVDVAHAASEALTRYVKAAKDNVLAKSKILLKVKTDPEFQGQRDLIDDVVKWLASDDNIEGIRGLLYDKTDKSQPICLDA